MAFTKVLGPGIHTQANILSHNINSSGIITATKFVGPFDGTTIGSGTTIGADGINVTGIVTATSLDINGNGDISGNLVVGGNLTANGDLTTLNTTLREVELLRVDANSSAAAGIITQTGAGDILNLFDGTTEVFTVLDTGEVGIGTVTPARDLHILNTTPYIRIESDAANQPATLELYHTRGNGSDHWPTSVATDDAALTFNVATAANGSPAEKVRITSDGKVGVGTVTPGKTVDIWSTSANADLRLKTTANSFNSLIFDSAREKDTQFAIIDGRWNGNDVARIQFVTGSDDTNYDDGFMAFHTRESGETLSERLRIDSTGKIGIGTVTPARKVHIHEDGSIANYLSFTNTTTGVTASSGFHIGIDASENAILNNYGNKNIEILCNGSERVRITSAGRVGIGTVTPTRGPLHVHENSNSDVQIHLTNSETGPTSTDGLTIFAGGDAGPACGFVNRETGGTIEFYTHNGTSVGERLRIDSSGNLLPAVANTHDLGSTSKEFRHLYLGDDGKVQLGLDQDFTIHHNNSHAIIRNTTGRLYLLSDDLWIKNEADNKTSARFMDGGEVFLYNNDTLRLTTTTTGITVGGEVAASQDYPNYRPTVDFNFVAVKKLDPRFTYVRTGPASYIDEFGKVVLVGDNTPRFDHDTSTRECKGLLIEESRTNLVTNSTLRTDGAESNITKTRAEGPDGVSDSALQVTYTAGGAAFIRSGAVSCSASTEYTFSIWIKKVSGSVNGTGAFYSYLTGSSSHGLFNTTGLVNTEGQSLNAQPTGVWKRFTQTKTTPSGTSAIDFVLPGYDSNGLVLQYYGLQLEAGGYATSFILTEGSTVARGAETVTMEGEEFTDFYNQTEGTIVLSASYTEDNRTSAIVTIDDTSNSSEYTEVGYRAGGGGSASVGAYLRNDASGDQYYKAFASSATQGNEFKVALAYKDNDYASSANGQTVHTDTSGTTCKVYDRLRFNHVDSVSPPIGSGHIRRFMYYPKRLPNGQVVTLTS